MIANIISKKTGTDNKVHGCYSIFSTTTICGIFFGTGVNEIDEEITCPDCLDKIRKEREGSLAWNKEITMKSEIINKETMTGDKVHGCRSILSTTTLCSIFIGTEIPRTNKKITCRRCLNRIRKERKSGSDHVAYLTSALDEKDNDNRKVIIIGMYDKTSVVIDYCSAIKLTFYKFNVNQIIAMVCHNWKHWTNREVTRENIKYVHVALIDRSFKPEEAIITFKEVPDGHHI